MSNTISLSEPQVDALMPTWTGIRLERGPNATNLAAFSLVTLIPYVAHQTAYAYVDTAGASSDWYRVARYGPLGLLGTYSPAWPVTPQSITTGDGTRRSLKNARRMLMRRLGGQVATATADGAVDGTTIISTGIATSTDGGRYKGWWALVTDGVSAGQIRRVGESALDPTTGSLSVLPALTSQVVRGTQIELSKWLPQEELDGQMGLRQALNLALAECWVLDRLALAGLANTVTYDISSLGDWLDPAAISEFYGPVLSMGFPAYPWGGFNPRQQGSVVNLDVAPGIAAGAGMGIELTRPADTLIKINGVWTDQQQGFQNDTDECLLQPNFVVEVALCYCLEALMANTTGAPLARLTARYNDQRTKVNLAKYRGLPHPAERPDHGNASYAANDWMSYLK